MPGNRDEFLDPIKARIYKKAAHSNIRESVPLQIYRCFMKTIRLFLSDM